MTTTPSGLTGQKRPATSGQPDALVIFVHGYGADGNDLIGLADPLAPHLPNVTFLAPNAPDPCQNNPMGFQWFPVPWLDGSSQDAMAAAQAVSVKKLDAYLDEVMTSENIDASRVVLLGFSQGTMMSLHVGPRRAQQLAGIVGFSGRLLDPEKLEAGTLTKPPILLIHGDKDDVVPFDSMPLAANALTGAGFTVYTHVSEGTAHGIAPDGLGLALQFIRQSLGES